MGLYYMNRDSFSCVKQFTPQSKGIFQCNGIALVMALVANALYGKVHFGRCKLGGKRNLRNFECGKAKRLLACGAVKVYMGIMMFVCGAVIHAKCIFGCAGAIVNDVNEAVLLKSL